MQIDQKVSDIYKKVLRLAEQKQYLEMLCKELDEKNKILTERLTLVEQALESSNEKLEEAEERYRSKYENEPKEKARLKKRLEQYVKEIDDCVDWLQNI